MAAYHDAAKRIRLIMVVILSWLSIATVQAQDKYEFEERKEEQRFQQLLMSTRCVVCQNQSLADSNSELAEDMRNKIYAMLTAGKTDQEIETYLVERYGPSILYEPPVQGSTWFLWLAPIVFLLIGIGVWFVVYNRNLRKKI